MRVVAQSEFFIAGHPERSKGARGKAVDPRRSLTADRGHDGAVSARPPYNAARIALAACRAGGCIAGMFKKRYPQSGAAPATVIASIFIPLTFLAGVYGMNFEHMPELHTRWGYFVLWGVMAVIAIGQFIFFRRKNWM